MVDRKKLRLVLAAWLAGSVLIVGAAVFVAPRLSRPTPKASPGTTAPRQSEAVEPFAGKPLPCGPKAYTDKQYAQVRLSYYRKRGVLAYQQFGRHNPAWDSLVTDYLEKNARIQAGSEALPVSAPMPVLARQVLMTGCDDPVVLYQVATTLSGQDRAAAEDCIKRAVEGFRHGSYPVYCQVGASLGMARVRGQMGRSVGGPNLKWREKAIATMAGAAQAKFFGRAEQRVFWENILNCSMENTMFRSQGDIVKALQAQPGTDPWLLQMALGKQALQEAWLVRGSGWASEVQPEAWPKFRQGLQVARKHWEKAYGMHPDFPEAATNMITVAKADGPESPRVWFDRAVAAQFDYLTAYSLMIDALLPRWGGSHEEMLGFAEACLNTGRFDTEVPMAYVEIVRTIAERDEEPGIWQDKSVWENVRAAYEGRTAYFATHRPDLARQLRTVLTVLAWQTGHVDTARQQLDATGGDVDHATFAAKSRENRELVVASIYAASDEQREAIKQAERLFQSLQTFRPKEHRKAVSAYRRLLRHAKGPQLQSYLKDRLQILRWEQELASGRWVDLSPTEGRAGWEAARGNFAPLPDGKGLLLTPDGSYALAVSHIRPGMRYEITCDVEFPSVPVERIEAGFATEIKMSTSVQHDACCIVREPPEARFGQAGGAQKTWQLREVPQKFRMQLIKNGDLYTLQIDDKPVFEGQFTGDHGTLMSTNVGLGGEGWEDQSKPVIYRNIRIRKTNDR